LDGLRYDNYELKTVMIEDTSHDLTFNEKLKP
jgi:hypothetical protein